MIEFEEDVADRMEDLKTAVFIIVLGAAAGLLLFAALGFIAARLLM